MRALVFAVIGGFLMNLGTALGQTIPEGHHYSIRTDALFWRPKALPLPPLVSTGDVGDAFPGATDQPGTRILHGGTSVDFGLASGNRLTVAGSCWEASTFMLESQAVGFATAANEVGTPPLFVPVYRSEIDREGRLRIAEPGVGLTGNLSTVVRTRMGGAEANGVIPWTQSHGVLFHVVLGLRYLELADSFDFDSFSNDTANDSTLQLRDRFRSRNQFIGGQIGLRAAWQYEALSLECTGKITLGTNRTTSDIYGDTIAAGTGSNNPGTFAGAIFAQPTNIGNRQRYHRSSFFDMQARAGYRITDHIRATLGYDALFWGGTVRVSDVLDRRINVSQTLGNSLSGPATPDTVFNRQYFWAHGLAVGLEVTF